MIERINGVNTCTDQSEACILDMDLDGAQDIADEVTRKFHRAGRMVWVDPVDAEGIRSKPGHEPWYLRIAFSNVAFGQTRWISDLD